MLQLVALQPVSMQAYAPRSTWSRFPLPAGTAPAQSTPGRCAPRLSPFPRHDFSETAETSVSCKYRPPMCPVPVCLEAQVPTVQARRRRVAGCGASSGQDGPRFARTEITVGPWWQLRRVLRRVSRRNRAISPYGDHAARSWPDSDTSACLSMLPGRGLLPRRSPLSSLARSSSVGLAR